MYFIILCVLHLCSNSFLYMNIHIDIVYAFFVYIKTGPTFYRQASAHTACIDFGNYLNLTALLVLIDFCINKHKTELSFRFFKTDIQRQI